MARNGYSKYRTGNRRGENYRQESRRTAYIYGNAVRELDVVHELETQPRKAQSREVGRNRAKARVMSFGYVLFLMAALFVCGYVLANYVQLTSEVTASARRVAALESELNTLKVENDESYNRIQRGIDLEKIRQIAIGELGMVYAGEEQIILYKSVGNDYMRKVNGN